MLLTENQMQNIFVQFKWGIYLVSQIFENVSGPSCTVYFTLFCLLQIQRYACNDRRTEARPSYFNKSKYAHRLIHAQRRLIGV